MANHEKGIARAAGTLLVVGLLALTLPERAFPQVGSAVGASARVIEAGPGWAAHHDVQQVIQRLLTPANPPKTAPGAAEMTDPASPSGPWPHPHSSAIGRQEGFDTGPSSIAYCEISMRNARVGRSAHGGSAITESSATVLEATAEAADPVAAPADLIISVHHHAN